jgi:hypothetical protein
LKKNKEAKRKRMKQVIKNREKSRMTTSANIQGEESESKTLIAKADINIQEASKQSERKPSKEFS